MSDDETKMEPRQGAERTTAAKKEAWEQTIEDMRAIAEDRREEGWEVSALRASHTDPVSRDMNDHDKFGLFHVLPKSDRQEFVERWDEEKFTEFLVYGAEINGSRFAVTEFLDPEGKQSILIANQYDLVRLRGLPENAEEEGALYTYIKSIDGTFVGSFRHEEYEPLLPQGDT